MSGGEWTTQRERKQLAKTCTTAKQASRYQWALYQQWESVQLVRAPIFSEEGLYVWAVSGQTKREVQP